jgi:hypothetical protein
VQGTFTVHNKHVWIQHYHGIHIIRNDISHSEKRPGSVVGERFSFRQQRLCRCGSGINVHGGALFVVFYPIYGPMAYVFQLSAIHLVASIVCLHLTDICILQHVFSPFNYQDKYNRKMIGMMFRGEQRVIMLFTQNLARLSRRERGKRGIL